jgi:hypothetical protein
MKDKILSIEAGLILLLVIALFRMPYGYYTFLRLVVTIYAAFQAFSNLNAGRRFKGWPVVFLLVGLIYNPIIIVTFEKAIWGIINVITIGVLLFKLGSENDKKKA